MNNKKKLFELQDLFLASRGAEDFSNLILEIEKLSKMILSSILREKELHLPYDKKEDIIQNALLYVIKKYSNKEFRFVNSFYSLIRLNIFGQVFGNKARREAEVKYYSNSQICEMIDGEYIESRQMMTVLEKELENYPDLQGDVERIISSGKSYQTQLYKINPKEKRDRVERLMIELKDVIYAE